MKHQWVDKNRVLPMMSHCPCLWAPHFDPATDNAHAASTQVILSNMKNKMWPNGMLVIKSQLRTNTWCASVQNGSTLSLTIITGVSDVPVWWCEDWLAWPVFHIRGGWYPHHIICQLVTTLRKICALCVRRPRRVVLVIHFFSQCKGSDATPTVIISPVPSNGRYPCHHRSTHWYWMMHILWHHCMP